MTLDFQRFEPYRSICPDWDAFTDSLRRPLNRTGFTNTIRITRTELLARLQSKGIDCQPMEWNGNGIKFAPADKLGNTFEYLTGMFNIQEEVAMTAAELLNPQPGDRLIDLCAAPGNKSIQMAIAMKNTGTVIANDKSAGRMRAVRSVIDRLGLINLSTLHNDASNLPRAVGGFDGVMADVPCSCEGTSRKNPGILKTRCFVSELIRLQMNIFKRAIEIAKPGARIVYATCTYSPEENEGVIAEVLKTHGDRVKWLSAEIPGFKGSPGLTHWKDTIYGPEFENARRFWPHQNDTGGFFVAVFEKTIDKYPEIPTLTHPRGDLDILNTTFERYGFPDNMLEEYAFFQANNKKMSVVNGDHSCLPPNMIVGSGIGFIRMGARFPKLTTASCVALGHKINDNVVDLDYDQALQYLRRQVVDLETHFRGHIVVRYDGFALGTALVREGHLESLFPNSLKVNADVIPI